MVKSNQPVIHCAICGATAVLGSAGWDLSRFDAQGEPILWTYLDKEESETEKFGRCPACHDADKRMPIGEIPEATEFLIRRTLKTYPGMTREKAFSKLLKYL